MLMTAQTTAKQVAAWLVSQGFDVKGSSEADDVMDGDVDLGDGMSVQVGDRYVIACQMTGEGDALAQFQGPSRENMTQLLEDLRRLKARQV